VRPEAQMVLTAGSSGTTPEAWVLVHVFSPWSARTDRRRTANAGQTSGRTISRASRLVSRPEEAQGVIASEDES
jgi:hypothetical protein